MTEEDAKTKRCGGPNGCGTLQDPHNIVNFAGDPVNAPRWCIASDCMTWTWEYWLCGKGCGIVDRGTIKDKYREPCKTPDYPQFYIHHGRCGLGGKP